MVVRADSMFGCYDSYSYRLWSLANIWNTCQLPPYSNGLIKEEPKTNSGNFIKCSQCQIGCQSFLALREHMETLHAESVASSENGISSNPSIPSPTPSSVVASESFSCSHCSSSFITKDQLEKHEMLHSSNSQVSCKICNKTFANVYRLQRHMISHDESALLRKFKCTQCEKAFKFKHHLKEHIRIHSGEKPFECGTCGKRFSHSGSYSSHMTSKKCLVINSRLGKLKTRFKNDKSTHQSTHFPKKSNESRVNMSNGADFTTYPLVLPKYPEALNEQASIFQTSLTVNASMSPFYLPSPGHSSDIRSPYNLPTLNQILCRIQQNVSSHNDSQDFRTIPGNHIYAPTISKNFSENLLNPNSSSSESSTFNEDSEEMKELDLVENTNKMEEEYENVSENVSTTKVDVEQMQRNEISPNNNDYRHISTKAEIFDCESCKQIFDTAEELDEHACNLQSEGLAAKLEASMHQKPDILDVESRYFEETHTNKCDIDFYCDSISATDHISEDGRRVRVRSLISEEQLKILKDKYALNPRPKREDLEKIASSIGFSVRVVQVWFQNTRARDRREGKLINVPYSPSLIFTGSKSSGDSPSSQFSVHDNGTKDSNTHISDEPLDLSTKKLKQCSESTPDNVALRSTSTTPKFEYCDKNDERKSPMGSLSYAFSSNNINSYPIDSSTNPSDLRNEDSLAQILSTPQQGNSINLPGMGLVPVEQIMHFGITSFTDLMSKKFGNKAISNSGGKIICKNEDDEIELSKQLKMSQYILKSLANPLLSNQDAEPEGQFICDQCDKTFSKQSSLARHKYEHSGQRPHKCDECPKAFKHKHHLTEHKRLHSGEKPFQCKKCLKRFSHSGSYSQHMNHRYSYCKPYRD